MAPVERPLVLGGLEQRPRVDAVRGGYDLLPSSWEKSISASASSIRRCWSVTVRDLRVIFSAARSAELAYLVADLAERLVRRLSICRRVSSSRRWRSSSVSVRTRSRWASAMLARLGEDLLGLLFRLADQLTVLLEEARLLAGRRPRRSPLMRSRRVVDHGLDPPEGEVPRTKT